MKWWKDLKFTALMTWEILQLVRKAYKETEKLCLMEKEWETIPAAAEPEGFFRPYDPKEYILTLDGVPYTGFADGTPLTADGTTDLEVERLSNLLEETRT